MKRRRGLLLLTGRPGVGKTTVITRVAASVPPPVRGFYTEEVRAGGRRTGFRVAAFGGPAGQLATLEPGPGPRVGRYRVLLPQFEAIALPALAPEAGCVYLVDEIGKMECLSARFVQAMEELLAADLPVVATVALTGGGFIAAVKDRGEVWTVTPANRSTLPKEVCNWLAQHRPPR